MTLMTTWRLDTTYVMKPSWKAADQLLSRLLIAGGPKGLRLSRFSSSLQTEDHARAVLSGLSGAQTTAGNGEEVEEQVALRMGRQELLYRDPAPSVRVLLDEGALRRPVPDAKVWRDQLSHLVDAAELPNVAVQVLPYAAGVHDLMDSHLWLLWQRVGDPVAYAEGNGIGESIDDPDRVLSFRLSYDLVRDAALTPVESTAFIKRLLEECGS